MANKFRHTLRIYDPYWTDLGVSFLSSWTAACLFMLPPDFARFPYGGPAYELLEAITAHERYWAFFVSIAAFLKISGMICLLRPKFWIWSVYLRKIGYAMSSVWWIILGGSALFGGFYILGLPPLFIAVRMVWLILADIALPVW